MTGDLGPLERETIIMKQELRFPVERLCPGNQPFVVLRGYPLCPPHQSGTALMYSEETDWDRCDLPKIPGRAGEDSHQESVEVSLWCIRCPPKLQASAGLCGRTNPPLVSPLLGEKAL